MDMDSLCDKTYYDAPFLKAHIDATLRPHLFAGK